MPPRSRTQKSAKKNGVGAHPQIEELPNLEAFENYVGHAEIPAQPLVERIAQLQAERDARLNVHPSPSTSSRGNSSTTAGSKPASSGSAPPKRYRNPPNSKPARIISQLDPEEEQDLTGVGRFMFGLLDYATYLIPIISVHLVLDVLVRVQYSEDTFEGFAQRDVLYRAAMAIPVFALLHHFVHPFRKTRLFRIASFFASVGTGGYLLYAGNEEGYYYIMKRAPPLGTLWVWMFVEMDWEWSAMSLIVVVFWMWLKDYSLWESIHDVAWKKKGHGSHKGDEEEC